MNKISAITAFIIAAGIVAGAFGAHALKDVFTGRQEEIWKTAVFYQLINAVGLIFISSSTNFKIACWLIMAGIFIFSGSLYILVLSSKNWLGAITPIGGSLLILGWLLVGVGFLRGR